MPTRSNKLGAPSRVRLQQLRDLDAAAPERVSMLLRGASVFSPDQIGELEHDGANVRTRAGVVLTVDVPLEAVESVLAHDFVVASELSAPLYPERGDDPPSDSE